MNYQKFCTYGDTAALKYAASALWSLGWEYDASAKIILLPVPSFDAGNRIKGGGRLEDIPSKDTVIFGGNLTHLSPEEYNYIDLLKDPLYVAENAAITAHCALSIAMERSTTTLDHCSVLVIGWGRIGKCLTHLLKQLGANVTVYARNPNDQAMLTALGYGVINDLDNKKVLQPFRILFNTVPAPMISKENLHHRQLKIDLASTPGIEGDDVIHARGLPSILAPESSGMLIAKTVDRLGKELFQ